MKTDVTVGGDDKNVGLGEYLTQQITITNLSKLPQKDKQITLRVNIGDIVEGVKLESKTRKVDLSTNLTENEIVEKDYNEVDMKDRLSDVRETREGAINNYKAYKINIKNIKGRETLRFTYLIKVTRENTKEVIDYGKKKIKNGNLYKKLI